MDQEVNARSGLAFAGQVPDSVFVFLHDRTYRRGQGYKLEPAIRIINSCIPFIRKVKRSELQTPTSGGNSHIRRILHMPAFSVVKYEQHYKGLYERVFDKTKIKMKGYVAVQRKILILIFTLWRNDSEYNPNCNKSSGNDEPKLLFSLGFEKAAQKIVPEQCSRTTQDELPCNESPEVLFSLV